MSVSPHGSYFAWMVALIIFWWMRPKIPVQRNGMSSDSSHRNSHLVRARGQMCPEQSLLWAIKNSQSIPSKAQTRMGLTGCVTNFPKNCVKLISRFNRPLWITPFAHRRRSWVLWIRSLPIATDLVQDLHIWRLKKIFQAALMFGLCFKPLIRLNRTTGLIRSMRCQQITRTNNWLMLWPSISVI